MLALPRSMALALGRFGGRCAYYLFPKRRRLAIANLKQVYGDSYDKTIPKKLFAHLGMTAVEFLRFAEINSNNLDKFLTFAGFEHLENAVKQKQGILILTAHMGNWELLAAAIGLSGFNANLVVKSVKTKWINDFLTRQRSSKNLKLFSGKNFIKDILKQLKLGGIVGVVFDQSSSRQDGILVPFFGYPAWTYKSLAILSQRPSVVVIPMYAYRDANNHHHAVIEAPIIHAENETLEERTAKYNAWLETAIRKYPDQWLWTHNRWKQRK